ncbi:MAG: DHH family phosphoesterase [Candidatus Magasanikbacteria bacterium]|jgi:phosphoesterase RecJ-like protein
MLNEIQQIKQEIENCRHVLIVFNNHENTDAIASALALSSFFEKNHKSADIACPNFLPSKNLALLNGLKNIKSKLEHLQKLIIKVDVSHAKIESLSYDIKDNWLSIYLTPKDGLLTKDELRTAQSAYKYDLIITLGTSDLETLGPIFLNNTDLFYRNNIVNIDYHANNERYGQINYIDLNATSIGEMIYRLSKHLWDNQIDENSATALLAGMIAATHSFKTTNVTPLTLQAASELINHGANREKIIQNLYRTRSLSTLKLWGTALSKLKIETSKRFAWTTVTKEEFTNCGANEEELKDIIPELIGNSPEIDLILILYEIENLNGQKTINGILHSKKGHDTRLLLKPHNPSGTSEQVKISLENITLLDAEKTITEEIIKSLN